MKVISKSKIIGNDSAKKHLREERLILERIDSPFLTKLYYLITKYRLHYAFQTKTKLILLVDYMNGGELFY